MIAYKGEKLFCLHCNSHLVTAATDMRRAMRLCAELFEPNEGFKYKNMEEPRCRECKRLWFAFENGRFVGEWRAR